MTDETEWEDANAFLMEEEGNETIFAQGRLATRTYASRSFPLSRTGSADEGQPARFIYKVFDAEEGSLVALDGTEWVVRDTPGGRFQVKLLVAREAGNVKDLWIQRVPASGDPGTIKNVAQLKGPEAARLVELLRALEVIPVEGAPVAVDDSLVQDLFADGSALVGLYRRNPERFRQLISDDESADDVVAGAARRAQVERFRRLMEDDDFFDEAVAKTPGTSAEAVWQRYFEENPWIFGISLTGQFLTSWNPEKLEQVVVGPSIGGPGKRTDALLRTAGRVRSMVFAEIKTHRTELLAKNEYRSGCWSASAELVGGIAQVQGTVHRAVDNLHERLADQAADDSEIPGGFTYLLRPRSFLVIGHLKQLTGEHGGDHPDRIRSFELFRRQLIEPEIVTFDELFARAEWIAHGPPL